MKIKLLAASVLVAFSPFVLNSIASAQGVVVPIICDRRPCPMPPRPLPPRPIPLPNVLPVKSIKIDTRIEGQVATTHLEQVFRNDTPYTLEGTYFFPIPESASIVEWAIWENGKKLVGEVRTREEARRIYDEIVRRQRDPGLLEYAGKDLFQASIFPIPPNSDKKLELKYSEVLKADSGTVGYRYPLGTGHNLWRRPLPDEVTPMRSRPVPQQQQFGTVSGRVEIVGREALRNIYSPSHEIEVNKKGENSAVISFESSRNANDFQLFYGLSNNEFGLSLLTYREPGKDGFFLLQLSPKDNLSERDLVNKDIVFVLDTSGSMADEGKMEKARNALLFGVRTLRDGDRFNIINFAGEEHLFEDRLTEVASGSRSRGEEFVRKLRPNGGTNINDALLAAMKQFDSSNRPKMLVFLTDGRPTIGEANIERIIENSRRQKVNGLRLFTFGVGYDVNTQLLDKLAEENRGRADYVEPKEDLEVKVSAFFNRVNSPVLTDIKLDFGDVRTDLMYPRALGDIFRGTQMTIIGRYRNESDLKNITLRLTGVTGSENRSFAYPNLEFPKRADKNDFLPRLWATRRVGWLLEQIRVNGVNKELRDEIVDLGTRYGIVTPYTSYLAIEDGVLPDNPRDRASRVDMNQAPTSGQGAVMASKEARRKQESVTIVDEKDSDVNESSTRSIRKIGVKTFYLRDGVWTDSEFDAAKRLPESTVKFASEEFFRMIAEDKEIARFLAVGERAVIVWRGRVIRVTE